MNIYKNFIINIGIGIFTVFMICVLTCERKEKKEPSHAQETKLEKTIATELDIQESIEHTRLYFCLTTRDKVKTTQTAKNVKSTAKA
jgi:hypothetical protein